MTMRRGDDTLRFTVTADTVAGVRAAADAYLRSVGADHHGIEFDMTTESTAHHDGAGRLLAMHHGPIHADVTVWLPRKGTTNDN